MNTKELPGIGTARRMKVQNPTGKQMTILAGIRRKLVIRNQDCKKNEIAKSCWEADHNFVWDQKKVFDRESRLIPRNIKETIHYFKSPNHINN